MCSMLLEKVDGGKGLMTGRRPETAGMPKGGEETWGKKAVPRAQG